MNNSIIDTLSVTFPVTYFKEFCNSGRMEDVRRVFRGDPYYLRKNIDESATVAEMKEQHSVDLMADFVAEWLYDFLGVDVVIQPIWRSGRNYFTYGFNFEGGFLAWGGNNRVYDQFGQLQLRPERVQVYFDATGCQKYINDSSCARLRSKLIENEGRISRCDVALDLMNGEVEIDDVEEAYFSGMFSGNGRPPKCVRVEEKTIGPKNAGDTLYVGSRLSGKYMRAYEKGKQLGDVNSPWVRVEIEYNTNNKRVISPDILINHDQAFCESYDYCDMIMLAFGVSVSPTTSDKLVAVVREKTVISLDALNRHCRRSYGALIYYLKTVQREFKGQIINGYSDSEIVDLLSRSGRPARLAC